MLLEESAVMLRVLDVALRARRGFLGESLVIAVFLVYAWSPSPSKKD